MNSRDQEYFEKEFAALKQEMAECDDEDAHADLEAQWMELKADYYSLLDVE